MTQNKTYLQDCINRVVDYQKWRRGDEDLQQPHPLGLGADLDELIKAAKAYAELPEMIEGMRKDAPLEKWVKDYNRAIKDILTLLENQND